VLSPWPVERPRNRTARVNGALAKEQLRALRECVDRGRPFGGEQWVAATAKRLGLEFTLRGPGRPRNEENE
jgi:putative transposase